MHKTILDLHRPHFSASAQAILQNPHFSVGQRLKLITAGMGLWFGNSKSHQDDARRLAKGVQRVQHLPIEQRSAFAEAFVQHAPANFRLETYSPPLIIPADRIDQAKPHEMTPPAAYLKMAETMLPQDRGPFLMRALPNSPTLVHNLTGFEDADSNVGIGYLKQAFTQVNRGYADRIMFALQHQLDGDTINYVYSKVGDDISCSALRPQGQAEVIGKPLPYRLKLGYNV